MSAEKQQAELTLWQNRLNELSGVTGTDHLRHYVYTLADPYSGKVFYVGKGQRARVLDHLIGAQRGGPVKDKGAKINEIWNAGHAVDWRIIGRGYESQDQAFAVEAAVIAALNIQGSQLSNLTAGNLGKGHGALSQADIRAMAAPAVNPGRAYETVFIFNVAKGLKAHKNIYDATRQSWSGVADHWTRRPNAVAVGLVNRVCLGAFSIAKWAPRDIDKRRVFTGHPLLTDDLSERNWTQIVQPAMGYFQLGNWLVVSFDGAGRFRFLKGTRDKTTWRRCIDADEEANG